MVVDVLVNVEQGKNVEGVAKVDVSRNGCIAFEDWKEVCGTDCGVDVDHRRGPVGPGVEDNTSIIPLIPKQWEESGEYPMSPSKCRDCLCLCYRNKL